MYQAYYKSQVPSLEFEASKRIEKITSTDDDINLIIKNLNIDKAHGWNKVSIRMVKLCGKSIVLPLNLIFQSILNDGVFPDDWKKSNVVPCHKKDSKNLIKNYRTNQPSSSLSKIFERLTYNSLYNYFIQNTLFTKCQSGFMPGDSCVSQQLSITHEI